MSNVMFVGSRPYPGIEVIYPKSDHVCQIFCFCVIFQIWHQIIFLYAWQLLDPAGSYPDPGMEVTFSKIYHV